MNNYTQSQNIIIESSTKFVYFILIFSLFLLLIFRFGDIVDLHDIVMRFNHAPVEGYVPDVGRKSTIRVVNSQVRMQLICRYNHMRFVFAYRYIYVLHILVTIKLNDRNKSIG